MFPSYHFWTSPIQVKPESNQARNSKFVARIWRRFFNLQSFFCWFYFLISSNIQWLCFSIPFFHCIPIFTLCNQPKKKRPSASRNFHLFGKNCTTNCFGFRTITFKNLQEKVLTWLISNNQEPPLQDRCHKEENGAHTEHNSDWECINLQRHRKVKFCMTERKDG